MVVYVECKPDVVLLKSLGFPRTSIKHAGDKGRICNAIEEQENVAGLADEDPQHSQPEFVTKYPLAEFPEFRLKVVRGRSTLVLLSPHLEGWLLWLAEKADIRLEDLGIPRDPSRWHRVINSRLDQEEALLRRLQEHPEGQKVLWQLRELLQET